MFRAVIEHHLRAAWMRRGPLAALLWPLSRLYGRLAARQRKAFTSGRRTATRLPVPVVVVGNVVAGGAGKTPATLAIVEHLKARGWRPGIVSRGHGRASDDGAEVLPGSDPRTVGDEPLLLHRRAGVPVFVAPRRADAGTALLAAHPGTDILVCDDGLQHAALARDVDVCVFDARGVGNGWLLPAGPLREPWPRAVDLVLWTETPPAHVEAHVGAGLPAMAAPLGQGRPIAGKSAPTNSAPLPFIATRRLSPQALRADGTRVPLADLRGQPLTAVAGIARPEAFFAMLRAAGLTLAHTQALPDHFGFDHWPHPPDTGATLICTEKDALKLWRHAPTALAVPLVLEVPAAFFAALDERLAARGYHPRHAPAPDA
ncbi:MAG: tetraacyldisaccharide 4'-kinase [Pseudomonadota bacterium]|nr:tetraacyldisaccharide 4'-kinase [Pseudomonadota bacterium]